MMRYVLAAVAVTAVWTNVCAAYYHGGGSPDGTIPVAMGRVEGGQLHLTRPITKFVTQEQKATRKRPVQETVNGPDGTPRTVTKYVDEVYTYPVTRPVFEMVQQAYGVESVKAQTIEGQAVDAATLSRLLAKETAVLAPFNGQMIADYYRAIHKPGTLVILINAAPAPLPGPPGPGALPVPSSASRVLRDEKSVAVRLVVDQQPKNIPNGPSPALQFASLADQNRTLQLRSISENTVLKKALAERIVGGRPETVEYEIKQRHFNSVTTSMPFDVAKVKLGDGGAVPVGELPQWLTRETLVVVSSDGKLVDPYWLQTVKPRTLILSGVPGAGHGPMMPAPAALPAPAAPIPVPPPAAPKAAPAAPEA